MTLDEMAKELGVSKSTVSRALSGKGRIGEKTKTDIQAYARKQGMWPKQKKEAVCTRNIGVVIPTDAYSNSIPFFQECLLGICEAASRMDYNVLVTRGMNCDISNIQTLVTRGKVDGIILTRSTERDIALQYLHEIHFPIGLTGICEYKDVIQVDIANEEATESMVSLLIGRGYKKFALIIGDISYKVNQSRYEGFCRAIQKNGLTEGQQFIHSGLVHMEFVDGLIGDIVDRKVECIICGDDVICTRIMTRMQSEGYRIPADISMVSLYNSSNLDCFSPAVTTVNISAKQVGNVIGEQMINYLQCQTFAGRTILDYEILFRKSTARIIGGYCKNEGEWERKA